MPVSGIRVWHAPHAGSCVRRGCTLGSRSDGGVRPSPAGIAVVLLWVVITFTFILSHVIPGNPALAMAGLGATKEQIHALYIQMGLNTPLPEQYVTYITGLVHLNLGRSDRTGDPVAVDLAHYLPATIELVVISFGLYVAIAVPLGAWSATHEGKATETGLRVSAIFGSAIPVFWLGALLQVLFFAHLGWLPEGGELAISQNSTQPRFQECT